MERSNPYEYNVETIKEHARVRTLTYDSYILPTESTRTGALLC